VKAITDDLCAVSARGREWLALSDMPVAIAEQVSAEADVAAGSGLKEQPAAGDES
jgi:hypothetical protein